MKTKVLVLGSTGLIGHQVYNYLTMKSDYKLSNISYRKKLNNDTVLLDVREEEKFLNTIQSIKPDVIINCIGILINGANKNPENAIFINAYMPHRLARLADDIGAKLIHISTDCVFSGNKKEPYIETDEKDGKDTYAKAKGLGEIVNHNHLTLRTSVVGPELKEDGEELFHWFMSQSGSINGFTKAIWSGVTTIELAKAVKWAIENDITGLYHVTNNMSINKNDLLNLFKKYTKKDIEIIPFEGKKVDKSFIDTRKEMNSIIPSYDVMVKEMVDLISNNKKLYTQYDIGKVSE
ncbi:MAG: SDR family oxidoreductase [Epsilonproteobacteria bacterium]|nr:SDR family oxidoreductase [Campylobacterota bacterium]OIO15904.1 MAG: NAD(P)-dependent oxidoreductase [Helicobacteraceae bacterium CG1_02_36_14]PIP10329.1 MAG: NAD(P)-dependent oxidoreductase [Sulfurimonas sp. CG23_combo_of_CG06-09_8_20_14_all_36_33]PIS25348.1 MAG: NAD(P)-dependent oxidoreductase [Sulfurimonas sp. CG08_land_8_20_14_0_20_36_33]PIU34522.1 MAG: NAD(P)-dependent oxidoreductase [Sulfurimonas sp. CG07_land_8_20_14_0_80_36_56]PIV02815.1 MAG: NAD(P)-dependent oxidoreductase [Sulfur